MNTQQEIRLRNIDAVITVVFGGNRASLSRALGHKNNSTVAQWFSEGAGARRIGEEQAREIEARLVLPEKWLDVEHQPGEAIPVGIDPKEFGRRRGPQGAQQPATISRPNPPAVTTSGQVDALSLMALIREELAAIQVEPGLDKFQTLIELGVSLKGDPVLIKKMIGLLKS